MKVLWQRGALEELSVKTLKDVLSKSPELQVVARCSFDYSIVGVSEGFKFNTPNRDGGDYETKEAVVIQTGEGWREGFSLIERIPLEAPTAKTLLEALEGMTESKPAIAVECGVYGDVYVDLFEKIFIEGAFLVLDMDMDY